MTTIKPYNIRATGEELRHVFKSFRQSALGTAGMEMERFILKSDGTLPDAATHDRFYLSLRKIFGDCVSVEPGAHMIEIKTGVHTAAKPLAADLLKLAKQLKSRAALFDLTVQPGSDLPGFDVSDLAANLISRIDPESGHVRRVWELVKTYQKHGWTDIANWGCGTASIHFTHAVAGAEPLYRWSKVHAALMPVYYAAFENRTRSADGIHEGLRLRRLMQERGLVAPYVFRAAGGDDFIDRYVSFILNNQLLTMLDKNGQDTELPHPMTFKQLPQEFQTLGNLLHAASVSWNVCKIKQGIDAEALKDGRIALSNLLLEVRDLDVSENSVPAMAGWLYTLTRSDKVLDEVEARLESLGVPVRSDPQAAGILTSAALLAVETDPRTLSTPFGAAGAGYTLRDAVNRIILPILTTSDGPLNALSLWREIAEARTPPFRAHNEKVRPYAKGRATGLRRLP